MIINIFNKIILFFALDKSDYNFIKESGYDVPTKVLNNKTNKRISCPDNMPSEYYQEIDFEEHIKLLLKDNNEITLVRRFGDNYVEIELEIIK